MSDKYYLNYYTQNKMVLPNHETSLCEDQNIITKKGIWWWEPPSNSIPKDFFADASMHGLKYLSQPKRHLCERIFWLVFFLIGIGFAAYLIYQVIDRYIQNPVIVSFSATDTDISQVIFPAVTICNMNKLRKSKYDEIFKKYMRNQADPAAKMLLESAAALCGGHRSFAKFLGYAYKRGRPKKSISANSTEQFKNDSITATKMRMAMYRFIDKETLNCDEVIRLCRWAGEETNCSLVFKETITENGKCCTFNGLPRYLLEREADFNLTNVQNDKKELWADWIENPSYLLPSDWNVTKYPKIQMRPGNYHGLSIALEVNTTDYYCPSTDSEGFQIVLHPPAEMPQVRDYGFSIPLEKEIFIKVVPDLIVAGDEIQMFDKEKRQCILKDGPLAHLDYFKYYTRTNCVTECITKEIIKKCECRSFYMPHVAKEGANRRCHLEPGGADMNCSREVRKRISENLHKECSQCETLCNDILFRTEITSSTLQDNLWNDTENESRIPKWAQNKVSIVHIFYGDLSTLPKVRKPLYGISDIIANIGGLLGLCLGFSVLSAIEILYFFTCRAVIKRMRRRTTTDVYEAQQQHAHVIRSMIFRSKPYHNGNRATALNTSALQTSSIVFLK